MTWIVAKGRWTQDQMDRVVKDLHRMVCGSFDGGQRNRAIPAGKLTDLHQIHHEAEIVHVVEALEHCGFKVMEP